MKPARNRYGQFATPMRGSSFWVIPFIMGGIIVGLCVWFVMWQSWPMSEPPKRIDPWQIKCQTAYRLLRKGECGQAFEELDR